HMEWREITTVEEWDDILNKSSEKDQIILKHSTTCPVSTNALEEYEAYLQDQPNENIDYTLVKVRESRPVSNKIEEDQGIKNKLKKSSEKKQIILKHSTTLPVSTNALEK